MNRFLWSVLFLAAALVGLISFRRCSDPSIAPERQTRPPEALLDRVGDRQSAKGAEHGTVSPGLAMAGVQDASLEATRLFAVVIKAHKHAREHMGPAHREYPLRWDLEWQERFFYVQARLLALAYPDLAEKLSIEVVDGTPDTDDLLMVTRILGTLASQGRRKAQEALVRIASRDDAVLAPDALDGLALSGSRDSHVAIYLSQCKKPMFTAFDRGPYWRDEQTKQTFEQLIVQYQGETSEQARTRLEAQEVVERLKILEDPGEFSKIEAILSNRALPDDRTLRSFRWAPWALALVRVTADKRVLPILRTRLDNAEARAGGPLELDNTSIKATEPGYAHSTEDRYFDEVLLTYQALGGALNQTETARLTFYGYLGNPVERLAALMSRK